MPLEESQALPFLTRKMLAFEHATTFSLRIRSQCAGTVTFQIRGFTKAGPFAFKHTSASTSVATTQDFRIPDVPISVNVIDTGDNVRQGQAYIAIYLVIDGDQMMELCSGFVYGGKSITYPNTNTGEALPGRANIGSTSGSNPAAGTEVSISVPTFEIWNIFYVMVQLITDATVANRRVHLRFTNGGGGLIDCFSDQDQVASTTRNYCFAKYGALPDTLDDTEILVPIPNDIYLIPESTIETATTNLQATDNFGIPRVVKEMSVSAT